MYCCHKEGSDRYRYFIRAKLEKGLPSAGSTATDTVASKLTQQKFFLAGASVAGRCQVSFERTAFNRELHSSRDLSL